jgi:hypothetical protein
MKPLGANRCCSSWRRVLLLEVHVGNTIPQNCKRIAQDPIGSWKRARPGATRPAQRGTPKNRNRAQQPRGNPTVTGTLLPAEGRGKRNFPGFEGGEDQTRQTGPSAPAMRAPDRGREGRLSACDAQAGQRAVHRTTRGAGQPLGHRAGRAARESWALRNSGDTILIAGACGAEASGVANTEDREQSSREQRDRGRRTEGQLAAGRGCEA